MNSIITRQIRKIKDLNEECYAKMLIAKDMCDKYIASGEHSEDTELRIDIASSAFNKKARDTIVSLNRIYGDSVYDDYNADMDLFFRNAKYVESNIPSVTNHGSILSFYVKFRNDGIFWSWTEDKGIKMLCSVTRSDGASYDTEVTMLDVTADGNVPGDQNTNQDYKKIKTFNLDFEIDMPSGEYTLVCSVSDNQNRSYNGTFTTRLRVV